jgi:hypothetical protein
VEEERRGNVIDILKREIEEVTEEWFKRDI